MRTKVRAGKLRWKIIPVLFVAQLLILTVNNGLGTVVSILPPKAQTEKTDLPGQVRIIFPETPAGQKGRLFWEAFLRSDTQGLKKFFESSLPKEKLKEIPGDKRAEQLLNIRRQLGEISLQKLLTSGPMEMTLILANRSQEYFRLELGFEKSGNNLFLQKFTIDEAGPEDLAPPLPRLALPEAIQGFEQAIEKAVQDDRFSGVVLVAKDFQPISFKPFGLASQEFEVPNRTDTRFNLGSINKIFTRIAIAQLVAKGELSLDDKLGQLLPDYPNEEAKEKVTVRHLVNMTSGIGDFFGPEFRQTPKDMIRHNRDYLRFFATKPLAFEPGSREMYSNGGYVVLGEIISAVSKMDYYDYIKRNIFEPAGMKDSDWFQADVPVKNVAEGYTRQVEEEGPAELGKPGDQQAQKRDMAQKKDVQEAERSPSLQTNARLTVARQDQGWRNNIYTRPARGSAAGGGYATAEDLLKFARALFGCELLNEAWTNWIFTGIEPQAENQRTKNSDRQEKQNQAVNNAFDEFRVESPGTGQGEETLQENKNNIDSGVRLERIENSDRTSSENLSEPSKIDRSRWGIGIAGGAPGINAILEMDGQRGYTIIVLSNYDPPAARDITQMIRRYLKAIKK
ncbi:MAG TPA: serine hydrolase domain-containing protein [Candidatus Saccharicenans sp.]|nr:serine hydrolase domain-containing protein [Candidatus Saccharicenans sp.]